MNAFNIIQQGTFPGPDYGKWQVIRGQRAPGGYPQGYKGKDWDLVAESLTYSEAQTLAATLNKESN